MHLVQSGRCRCFVAFSPPSRLVYLPDFHCSKIERNKSIFEIDERIPLSEYKRKSAYLSKIKQECVHFKYHRDQINLTGSLLRCV